MDIPRPLFPAVLVLAALAMPGLRAEPPDPAELSMQRFLTRDHAQSPYRAIRQLEARTGNRSGWLEAVTEYSPATGLTYDVTREGGSGYIRDKVLRAVLDGERDVIARGETGRAALSPANYTFRPNGIDADGLAEVLLSPRRKERALVAGRMSLHGQEGRLVRLEGRLAKSPSFWIRNVDIVRSYECINGVVVPVSLESTAQLRFFGAATFQMTYLYSQIDGQPVPAAGP